MRQLSPPNATMHVHRFNSRTGDWVYHTPIAPSFNLLFTTPTAPSVQPLTTFGNPHPSYVTTPTAPSVQPLTIFGYPHPSYYVTAPSAPSVQPLATFGYSHPSYVTTRGLYPAALQPWAVSPSPTSSVAVPSVPAPSREKNTRKYYVWEKFTDEDGRAVWIHTVSGKRTLVDLYNK